LAELASTNRPAACEDMPVLPAGKSVPLARATKGIKAVAPRRGVWFAGRGIARWTVSSSLHGTRPWAVRPLPAHRARVPRREVLLVSGSAMERRMWHLGIVLCCGGGGSAHSSDSGTRPTVTGSVFSPGRSMVFRSTVFPRLPSKAIIPVFTALASAAMATATRTTSCKSSTSHAAADSRRSITGIRDGRENVVATFFF